MVDEDTLATGGAELGGLSVWVLLPIRDSGITESLCHAENGRAEVPARFSCGRGFRRIDPRRVAQLLVDGDESAVNDQFRSVEETSKKRDGIEKLRSRLDFFAGREGTPPMSDI